MYNKYHNKKLIIDGLKFDSIREAKRYLILKDLENKGEIINLECQKEFVLIPRQVDKNNKFKFHPIKYICDFYYKLPSGEEIVEDSKGFRTSEYRLKKKMMYYFHNIEIKEV